MQAFCESREGRLDSYGKKRRKRDTQRQPRLLDDNINLREMFKVYETRDEISDDYEDEEKEEEAVQPRKSAKRDQFCLSDVEYYGIVTTIVVSTYSEVFNKRTCTAIYFKTRMGQKWPKSFIFMY